MSNLKYMTKAILIWKIKKRLVYLEKKGLVELLLFASDLITTQESNKRKIK